MYTFHQHFLQNLFQKLSHFFVSRTDKKKKINTIEFVWRDSCDETTSSSLRSKRATEFESPFVFTDEQQLDVVVGILVVVLVVKKYSSSPAEERVVTIFIIIEETSRRTSANLALIPSYSNLPHPAKTAKGGEDAWFIKPDVKGGGVIGVATVGGFGDQGVDPGLYARVLAFECLKAHQVSTNPLFGGSDPKAMILQAQKETKLPGASTLCVVEIDKSGQLPPANAGDSGFKVIRGGEVVFESTPSQHYFNCPFQLGYMPLSADADDANECAEQYSFKAMEGDIIVVGEHGVFDNVFNEELVRVVGNSCSQGLSYETMARCADIVLVSRRTRKIRRTRRRILWRRRSMPKETGTKIESTQAAAAVCLED